MTDKSRRRLGLLRNAAVLAATGLIMAANGRQLSARGPQAGTSAPQGALLTIPYLANVSKPEALDFAAAQCSVAVNGEEMICQVRQLFITPSTIDVTTCVVTTNGYERAFHRSARARWVSAEAPEGECGRVETTTLEDGGGTHWTMTVATAPTRNLDTAACRSAQPAPERYDWRGLKRRLPCSFIQPGAIER